MHRTTDIAILGGGPAGCAAALALRKHDPSISVTVVESSSYGRPRIGETLPPPTRRLLEHLDVWEAFLEAGHDTSYGTAAAWGDAEPFDNEYFFQTYREGWHLDRSRFDALLARRAEELGVEMRTECAFVGAERGPHGWRLDLRTAGHSPGAAPSLEARLVIDATGRRAAFARRQGIGRMVCDALLGLYVFFRLEDGAEAVPTRALVEAWEEGWWYSARLPDDRLVIACMSDADRIAQLGLRQRERWMAALDETSLTRRCLPQASAGEGPTCHAAQSQLLDQLAGEGAGEEGGGGWLAVGDAASTYDPLSSQGIFKALRFGIWAAYAAADHLAGTEGALEKYARLVRQDFDGYLGSRLTYYRQEARWPASPFWRRRHGCITLDPARHLCAVAEGQGPPERTLSTVLPACDIERLRELCREPKPAQEIVAAFHRGGSSAVSDQRVILALQDLLEQGIFYISQ